MVTYSAVSSRPVDKRRAQKIQLKKREDISDAEEAQKKQRAGHSPLSGTPLPGGAESRKPSSLITSTPGPTSSAKKKKKRPKV